MTDELVNSRYSCHGCQVYGLTESEWFEHTERMHGGTG